MTGTRLWTPPSGNKTRSGVRESVPRIVFINRYFYPDHSATSQMLSDLAFFLATAQLLERWLSPPRPPWTVMPFARRVSASLRRLAPVASPLAPLGGPLGLFGPEVECVASRVGLVASTRNGSRLHCAGPLLAARAPAPRLAPLAVGERCWSGGIDGQV